MFPRLQCGRKGFAKSFAEHCFEIPEFVISDRNSRVCMTVILSTSGCKVCSSHIGEHERDRGRGNWDDLCPRGPRRHRGHHGRHVDAPFAQAESGGRLTEHLTGRSLFRQKSANCGMFAVQITLPLRQFDIMCS